ncbi:MAG: T9SS type A sorting domain-containing protein [Chitinophagales bacterium]|nr:T9SS type A sorting domain-containing protein [Chitinophagales bacterium]
MKNFIRVSLLLLFFCIQKQRCHAQAATFEISYIGTSEEAETAIGYAADIWSQYLISDIPVKISVHFQLLTPGLLGITFPNGIMNFSGAEVSDIWYPTALANAMAGTELNPGYADIEIYLNSTMTWYFGTDGLVPAGKYDLVTVAMHEMGHGLGIIGLANKTGSEGSFGTITADLFAPLTTSFPWPDLDTLPSIFDTYMEDEGGSNLITYTNPSADLGAAFTSNNIWYNSPTSVIANDGSRPKIYAPATYALGSSCTHLDEVTYPPGNENELMTPNGTTGSAHQYPGPIVLGILSDIGWEVTEPVYVEGNNFISQLEINPNPASRNVSINVPPGHSVYKIEVFDINGRVMHTSKVNEIIDLYTIDTGNLLPGTYFVKIFTGDQSIQTKFLKL